MASSPDCVAVLRRWEDSGGVWRVLTKQGPTITIGLFRRDRDEEADRLVADDPRLSHFLAGRIRSDEPRIERDRDEVGRARQARPRDRLGRPLPYGSCGVDPVSEEPMPPSKTINFARQLLNQGRPFSAHEVFEARWKASPEAERDLWQGLAQLCVGITHAERGNQVGALRLATRARLRLETYAATDGPRYGLNLSRVIHWIQVRENARDNTWLAGHPL